MLGAHELLLIHRGELAAARSAITSSMPGYGAGENSFQVTGTRVRYGTAVWSGRSRWPGWSRTPPATTTRRSGSQLAQACGAYVQTNRDYTRPGPR